MSRAGGSRRATISSTRRDRACCRTVCASAIRALSWSGRPGKGREKPLLDNGKPIAPGPCSAFREPPLGELVPKAPVVAVIAQGAARCLPLRGSPVLLFPARRDRARNAGEGRRPTPSGAHVPRGSRPAPRRSSARGKPAPRVPGCWARGRCRHVRIPARGCGQARAAGADLFVSKGESPERLLCAPASLL